MYNHTIIIMSFSIHVGVEVEVPGLDPFVMTAHVICCSCDLPGKALVQNFVQYNGEYGCGYCEQPGRSLRTENGGNVRVFPYQVDNPKGERRTTTVCADQHAKDAMESNSVVSFESHIRVCINFN